MPRQATQAHSLFTPLPSNLRAHSPNPSRLWWYSLGIGKHHWHPAEPALLLSSSPFLPTLYILTHFFYQTLRISKNICQSTGYVAENRSRSSKPSPLRNLTSLCFISTRASGGPAVRTANSGPIEVENSRLLPCPKDLCPGALEYLFGGIRS